MAWIKHEGVLYNLAKFTQIIRGDEDEILLVDLPYNDVNWENKEDSMCSLIFKCKEKRDSAFKIIEEILECQYDNNSTLS